MNLLEVRTALVQRSGRHDLVTDVSAYADNGMNAFIQEGQRWLDRRYFVDKARGRYYQETRAGDVGVIVPDCRAIEEVWASDSDSREQLEKVEMNVLRGITGYNEPFSEMDTGAPAYYCPTVIRMVPENTSLSIEDADAILGYSEVMFDEYYGYNGVLCMPPSDGTYVMEVVGLFYTPKLTTDLQQNNWSVIYPDVLMMATLRQIEVFYRNTEGVNDWSKAIEDEMFGITADAIHEEIEGFDKMEG